MTANRQTRSWLSLLTFGLGTDLGCVHGVCGWLWQDTVTSLSQGLFLASAFLFIFKNKYIFIFCNHFLVGYSAWERIPANIELLGVLGVLVIVVFINLANITILLCKSGFRVKSGSGMLEHGV